MAHTITNLSPSTVVDLSFLNLCPTSSSESSLSPLWPPIVHVYIRRYTSQPPLTDTDAPSAASSVDDPTPTRRYPIHECQPLHFYCYIANTYSSGFSIFFFAIIYSLHESRMYCQTIAIPEWHKAILRSSRLYNAWGPRTRSLYLQGRFILIVNGSLRSRFTQMVPLNVLKLSLMLVSLHMSITSITRRLFSMLIRWFRFRFSFP